MQTPTEIAIKYHNLYFSHWSKKAASEKLHAANNVKTFADLRHYMGLHHQFCEEEANDSLERAFDIILRFNGIEVKSQSWKYAQCSEVYQRALEQAKRIWQSEEAKRLW